MVGPPSVRLYRASIFYFISFGVLLHTLRRSLLPMLLKLQQHVGLIFHYQMLLIFHLVLEYFH